jgi:hypothetical protein
MNTGGVAGGDPSLIGSECEEEVVGEQGAMNDAARCAGEFGVEREVCFIPGTI